MITRILRFLFALILALGAAGIAGCGGGAPGGRDDGAVTDGEEDGGGDIVSDQDDGGGGDQDGGVTDGGGKAREFKSLTSGGARISSDHYRMDLFIAPIYPVGTASSASYSIKYGPGAIRSTQ